jgi:hypothetical protein
MLCALGFRAHSGWSVLVAVTEPLIGPAIEVRRMIETADPRIAGSKQPFHAAEKLPFKESREAHQPVHGKFPPPRARSRRVRDERPPSSRSSRAARSLPLDANFRLSVPRSKISAWADH